MFTESVLRAHDAARVLVTSTLVAIAGALLSMPLCAQQQQEHKYEFTEVAGNKIAWSCSGSGQPNILLIAGSGLAAHQSFGRIYHSYDGPGRICMYDRAGMGESKFAEPKTRTFEQMIEELHAVGVAAAANRAVIVAHSFGGFLARGYAQKYPADVQAILFLDVAQEDWLPHLKAKMSSSDWAIMEHILDWNTRTFHEDYWQAQEAVRATQLPKDLPITVLTRGIPHTSIRVEHMSYQGVDYFESEHIALQSKIAALSANSQQRVARYSSHIFNDYDPWIVIDEIKLLIQRLPKDRK
jgi:pimeloyl-ACP methyl ester carboxylesterase